MYIVFKTGLSTNWLSSRNFSGGKIYCYANFSIVFGPNFGVQKSLKGGGGQSQQLGLLSFMFLTQIQIYAFIYKEKFLSKDLL